MDIERLRYMANQIARNLAPQGEALAVEATQLFSGIFPALVPGLGTALGAVGFAVASLVYGLDIGTVIGLTIVSVCTMAATVGGMMPLLAKTIRVDPAVFSTPFISTFCDATGLIIYFMIAKTVLGI